MLYFGDNDCIQVSLENGVKKKLSLPHKHFQVRRVEYNDRGDAIFLESDREIYAYTHLSTNEPQGFSVIKLPIHGSTKILQCEWHPLSNTHLVILTSDQHLMLYNLAQTLKPEQSFGISAERIEHSGQSQKDSIVCFDFGKASKWNRFTIYLLTSEGSMFILCPVIPFQCSIPESCFQNLLTDNIDNAGLESYLSYITRIHYQNVVQTGTIRKGYYQVISQGPFQVTESTKLCTFKLIHSKHHTGILALNKFGEMDVNLLLGDPTPKFHPKSEPLEFYSSEPLPLVLESIPIAGCVLSRQVQQLSYPFLVQDPAHSEIVYCKHIGGIHQIQLSFLLHLDDKISKEHSHSGFSELQKVIVNRLFDSMPISSTMPTSPRGLIIVMQPRIGYFMLFIDHMGKMHQMKLHLLKEFGGTLHGSRESKGMFRGTLHGESKSIQDVSRRRNRTLNVLKQISTSLNSGDQLFIPRDADSIQLLKLMKQRFDQFQDDRFNLLKNGYENVREMISILEAEKEGQNLIQQSLKRNAKDIHGEESMLKLRLQQIKDKQKQLKERFKIIRKGIDNIYPVTHAEKNLLRMLQHTEFDVNNWKDQEKEVEKEVDDKIASMKKPDGDVNIQDFKKTLESNQARCQHNTTELNELGERIKDFCTEVIN